MGIQQLAEIAARYVTAMADAMICACVAKALETGEPLRVPERAGIGRPAHESRAAHEDVDWERMVRLNSDTREMHC